MIVHTFKLFTVKPRRKATKVKCTENYDIFKNYKLNTITKVCRNKLYYQTVTRQFSDRRNQVLLYNFINVLRSVLSHLEFCAYQRNCTTSFTYEPFWLWCCCLLVCMDIKTYHKQHQHQHQHADTQSRSRRKHPVYCQAPMLACRLSSMCVLYTILHGPCVPLCVKTGARSRELAST